MNKAPSPEEGGLRGLLRRLEGGRFAPLVQFVKFGAVGVGNTLVSYAVEMLFLYVILAGVWNEGELRLFGRAVPLPDVRWAVCSALGFIAGVVNSYALNSRFVFREGAEKRSPVRAFLKLAAGSVLISLVLAYFLKLWLRGSFGMAEWLASACSLLITVPLNFLAGKFWAFK